MKGDKFIELVSSKHDNYYIYENVHGFYAEVKTRNLFQLFKEYYTDFIGGTYIHPQFLSNFHSSSLESIKENINILIKLKNERNNQK